MRTLLALSICASIAYGQTPAQSALALAIARVSANEASLSAIHSADVVLIWQVTLAHGDTEEERLEWLTRHSSCVLGDRPLTRRELLRTNCPWTRHLDGDEQPEGWPVEWSWSVNLPSWQRVRDLSLRLVMGVARVHRPCRFQPTTWGSPRPELPDLAYAAAHGLERLYCIGTHNEGFRPRRESRATRLARRATY